VVALLSAYLLGSVPSAVVVGRRRGHDPTTEGSGNPGASNVYRLMGRRAGAVVLLLDLAKGAAAAGLGYALAGRQGLFTAGAAAVVGHCFPLTRWRRGGKGVATAAGFGVVAFPALALVGLATWAVLAAATRKASLASLAAIVAVTVAAGVTGRPGPEVATTAAIAALILVRHGDNVRRLLSGREQSLN